MLWTGLGSSLENTALMGDRYSDTIRCRVQDEKPGSLEGTVGKGGPEQILYGSVQRKALSHPVKERRRNKFTSGSVSGDTLRRLAQTASVLRIRTTQNITYDSAPVPQALQGQICIKLDRRLYILALVLSGKKQRGVIAVYRNLRNQAPGTNYRPEQRFLIFDLCENPGQKQIRARFRVPPPILISQKFPEV